MDQSTQLPMDSVLVEVLTASGSNYTDSSGTFDVQNEMGKCIPKCNDIIVRFSKQGYQTITLTNPEKNTVVWMEK